MSPDWAVKAQPVPYAQLNNPQTLNLYAYMRNNPLGGVDPDGHCDWCQKFKNFLFHGFAVTNDALPKAQYTAGVLRQWYKDHPPQNMPVQLGIVFPMGFGGAGALGAMRANGGWQAVNESMSESASAYQTQITGASGQAYVIDGVKFDGLDSTGLIEAKGPGYAKFVSNGEFEPWFKGADDLVSQAQRQLSVANGQTVTWHVAEPDAVGAINNLFQTRGIQGINVVYTPPTNVILE